MTTLTCDTNSFPEKVYQLLQNESQEVVRWLSHGLAFKIIDPERFSSEILPKYFRHDKSSSFQRQLNLYGFRKITKGVDMGATFHPSFQRDNRELLSTIARVAVRSSVYDQSTLAVDNDTHLLANGDVTPTCYFKEQIVKAPYKLSGYKRVFGGTISDNSSGSLKVSNEGIYGDNSKYCKTDSSAAILELKELEIKSLESRIEELLRELSEKDQLILKLLPDANHFLPASIVVDSSNCMNNDSYDKNWEEAL